MSHINVNLSKQIENALQVFYVLGTDNPKIHNINPYLSSSDPDRPEGRAVKPRTSAETSSELRAQSSAGPLTGLQ